LGISVDSVPCLKAWAESLGGITYPLLSDFYPHGAVAEEFGVLRHEGTAERAIFVIDTAGTVRYVDVHDIDEQPDNDVLLEVLDKIDPWPDRRPPVQAKAAEPAAPTPDIPEGGPAVTLYCTPWCPACRRARAFFKERGIQIAEVDISRDREAAKRVREWANGFETTPTFEVNGQVVVDFKQEQVAQLEKLLSEM
jgi:alkyl hydroperoxide reductase subunit AhpC